MTSAAARDASRLDPTTILWAHPVRARSLAAVMAVQLRDGRIVLAELHVDGRGRPWAAVCLRPDVAADGRPYYRGGAIAHQASPFADGAEEDAWSAATVELVRQVWPDLVDAEAERRSQFPGRRLPFRPLRRGGQVKLPLHSQWCRAPGRLRIGCGAMRFGPRGPGAGCGSSFRTAPCACWPGGPLRDGLLSAGTPRDGWRLWSR